MELIKITDLSAQLGLSSRTLRYYEEAGLITSVRPQFEAYRFYDGEAVERLRQIIVLRKMQIPIKDIIEIYKNPNTSTIVGVFVKKINEINSEVTTLSELKKIINAFLKKMTDSGIKKISALPLLYEEMDRQLALIEEEGPVTYDSLESLSDKLAKPLDISIIHLPEMRVLSSYPKSGEKRSDTDAFTRYLQMNGMKPEICGRFEYEEDGREVIITKIPDNRVNDSDFLDLKFAGGYFAAANVYLDDDLSAAFRSLAESFDNNKFYQLDYTAGGSLRHPAMLENLISPDDTRRLVTLYVPVKKRVRDPKLYPSPTENGNITIAELERRSPILWTKNVPLDTVTGINGPHIRLTDSGELEYTGWISTRTLNTNVSVSLPFRVDLEFRVPMDDEHFGYGDSEGSVIVYHGDDTGYESGVNLGVMDFGININNHADDQQTAIAFHQPLFHDRYYFPHRGNIKPNVYNRVTWLVGQKHLAVIINGEIRYCGENFPYMTLDLGREQAYPVVVGSNGQGMKYFKSIRISQLVYTPEIKIKNGGLTMLTKQSNNIITVIHRLITDEYGENYWFNGCARYVMECLGEADYDYQFFAGLTGDVFAQHYRQPFMGDSVDVYYQVGGEGGFYEKIFAKCGYSATFLTFRDLCRNKEMYRQTLMAYIDRGVPVISLASGVINTEGGFLTGVFVGYEDYGKTLLYITGNDKEPKRISYDDALTSDRQDVNGWIFVGEKNEQIPLAKIYREAIGALPALLKTDNDKYCFGSAAFRKWADDVENGYYDGMKPEQFDAWPMYTNFVCVLATNGSCCYDFLNRAKQLNPDMTYLDDVAALYRRTGEIWNNDNGCDLEALGGGFNITLETLQSPDKRRKIAARIRECGDIIDKIVDLLNNGSEKTARNQ